MAEKLTVRERIVSRVVEIYGAAMPAWLTEDLAAGRIDQQQHDDALAALSEKWDVRGNSQFPFTLVVSAGEQETEPGGMGGPQGAIDTHTLELEVEAKLSQRPRVDGAHVQASAINETSETVHNRWLGRMALALRGDLQLTEAGSPSVQLCPTGVRMTGASSAPPADETTTEFYALLIIEVEHDTYELNLYAGPSIPEKEV